MNLTDFAPDAHRLAMELECLLLDCTDTRAVSKWWDSANEALDQHRAFCATIEAEATKPCVCGEPATPGVVHRTDGPCYLQEATKPQEPIGYDDIFNAIAEAASPCGEGIGVSVMAFKRVIGGEIYTTPQHCPKCAEGMVSVAKEDANNYCRIVTLLGMEEEGSPVDGVEYLISLRDGMTCGDCNDTGWLENREEGRYPCTCMTEAEPYQLLEAERDALAMKNQQMRAVLLRLATLGNGEQYGNSIGNCIAQEALSLPDTSEIIKRNDADKKDAERYRWLRPNLLAADFDWNESGESAIVFKWPRSVPVGADCDKNIDAAIDAEIGAQL